MIVKARRQRRKEQKQQQQVDTSLVHAYIWGEEKERSFGKLPIDSEESECDRVWFGRKFRVIDSSHRSRASDDDDSTKVVVKSLILPEYSECVCAYVFKRVRGTQGRIGFTVRWLLGITKSKRFDNSNIRWIRFIITKRLLNRRISILNKSANYKIRKISYCILRRVVFNHIINP